MSKVDRFKQITDEMVNLYESFEEKYERSLERY